MDGAGRIAISTYPERAKTANVRRTGTASVVILSDEFNGPWVQIDGAAAVLDMPAALDGLVGYYRTISASIRTGRNTATPCAARASP